MKGAAETVKKISLELGGHAPVIVFADADLDLAVKGVVQSKFRNCGQTCICANRIYVDAKIAREFTKKLVEATKQLKVGYGLDSETDIGPLIDEDAFHKVINHINDAVQNGANLEFGGKRVSDFEGGYFIEPTVISTVNDSMKIMNEETFGPVAPIITFDDIDEVIDRANNSIYGLAAYAYTESLKTAIYVSEKLEYGIVGINDGVPSTAQAPFGGFKQSGLGREGGHHGIEEFLETKYVSIQL